MKYITIILLFFSLCISAQTNSRVKIGGSDNEYAQKVVIVDTSGAYAVDVRIQDQTTRPFFDYMCRAISAPYTLSVSTVPGSYKIKLEDATGLIAGDKIGLFQNSTEPQSYFGNIISVSGDTLIMDTPLGLVFSLETNTPVLFEIDCDLNDNGSVTPVAYSISNDGSQPIDITRIIIHIEDNAAMDDGLFGGLTKLTKGIVLRKRNADGTYFNYWNVKTNGDIASLCYDTKYDDKAPSGVYGFTARLTFAGQNKIGVVVRLEQYEDLELLIQDNLTGLTKFNIMAEGHFTDE